MRGSSRGSAKAAQAAFDAALAGDPAWDTLAEELFGVTGVVDGNASLRRALADPSRDGSDKSGLARALFSPRAVQRFFGMPVQTLEYFAEQSQYDTTNASRDLAPLGVRCPPLPEYMGRLVDFYRQKRGQVRKEAMV